MILPFSHTTDTPKILPPDVPILNKVIAEKEVEIAKLEADIILCPWNRNSTRRRIEQIKIVIASCSRLAALPALTGQITEANEIH